MTTIFQKIIKRDLPAEIVYESDAVIAIKDIHPAAPVHVLIISKKEIPNFQSITPEDYPILNEMIKAAQDLAVEFGISQGYRLLTNNGSSAGQSIYHLHFHLIGGRDLGVLG